jgi:putative transcriptional regulator
MTVNNRFAVLLAEKQIKERRNISLQEVAKKTGVSRKTLYAWENNRVNRFDVPVIDALCTYFDIEAGELIQFIRDNDGTAKQESTKPAKPRKVKKPA